jgi:hypothetical protein
MNRRKKIDLLSLQTAEKMKLAWEIRRQAQQEILQEKLLQCFLKPRKGRKCIQRYPEAMQPMIEDFLRRAEEQKRLYCI